MYGTRSMEKDLLNYVKHTEKEDSVSRTASSDSVPLLINSENCTEMRELRPDYISTISN